MDGWGSQALGDGDSDHKRQELAWCMSVHTCESACKCMRVYVGRRAYVSVCMYACLCEHLYVCASACARVYLSVCKCRRTACMCV